jgi:hypothetical protein
MASLDIGEESGSGSDDETEEEDPRVEKFKAYLLKHTVEQSVALLNTKICGSSGCKPLVIGEMMCFKTNTIMFYILSEALFELGPEKISAQFKNRGSAYYKALCGDDSDRQLAAICSLERFVVEAEDIPDLHPILNSLYSSDVVNNDETFEKWFETAELSRFVLIFAYFNNILHEKIL